jgi:Ni/Fe-hydrogenase subunit HybB-like protein
MMSDSNRWLKDLFWTLAFCGLLAILFRLWFGLGPTTNLSDELPWGLWKILNMVAGVALATGGFTVGFLVYVLRLEQFRPLVKPAILVAFLGYGSSVFALVMDIGLPHRIWHPIFMWNEHSFLFEVAWCVMLYFTVTMVELSPTVLERMRLDRIARFLHRIAPAVVVIGIALSSLHHSSLGSLFLVTPLRLHPLWYSPLIPWHFILSAIGAGMMAVVLVKMLYARYYAPESVFGRQSGPGPDFPMVRNLASIAAFVLSVYLSLKIFDLAVSGSWRYLVAGSWQSWFYALELLLAAVIPIAVMIFPRSRRSPAAIALASLSAVIGLLWNRLDVGVFGFFHDAKAIYIPSATEWALSLGVVAAAGLTFFFAVENLPIFDTEWRRRREIKSRFTPAFDQASRVWRTALGSGLNRASLIAVFIIPIAWLTMYPPFHGDRRHPAQAVDPPIAVDAARDMLRIDANRAKLAVEFPHSEHKKRLGGEESCINCHHVALPGDHSTPCSRCHEDMERATDIFEAEIHLASLVEREQLQGWIPRNRTCALCHSDGEPESLASAKPCMECHQQDMHSAHELAGPHDLRWATGFRRAMHVGCISCHKKEAEASDRPNLAECSTCHEDLQWREGVAGGLQIAKNSP